MTRINILSETFPLFIDLLARKAAKLVKKQDLAGVVNNTEKFWLLETKNEPHGTLIEHIFKGYRETYWRDRKSRHNQEFKKHGSDAIVAEQAHMIIKALNFIGYKIPRSIKESYTELQEAQILYQIFLEKNFPDLLAKKQDEFLIYDFNKKGFVKKDVTTSKPNIEKKKTTLRYEKFKREKMDIISRLNRGSSADIQDLIKSDDSGYTLAYYITDEYFGYINRANYRGAQACYSPTRAHYKRPLQHFSFHLQDIISIKNWHIFNVEKEEVEEGNISLSFYVFFTKNCVPMSQDALFHYEKTMDTDLPLKERLAHLIKTYHLVGTVIPEVTEDNFSEYESDLHLYWMLRYGVRGNYDIPVPHDLDKLCRYDKVNRWVCSVSEEGVRIIHIFDIDVNYPKKFVGA